MIRRRSSRVGPRFVLIAAVSLLAHCACEPTVDGTPVACETDADCAELGPEFHCLMLEGLCVRSGSADAGTPDGGAPDAGAPDGGASECTLAADCDALHGAPPCGVWTCPSGACEVDCPGCTDWDRDGYGPEPSCAGPDCNDGDDAVFDSVRRSCYGGPPGTEGVGTCRAGVESCTDGVWTPCSGAVVPSGEACNLEDDDCDGTTDEDLGEFVCGFGDCETRVAACDAGSVGMCVAPPPNTTVDNDCDGEDDDCDGATDEDCAPCVHVTPAGDDRTADGSAGAPFGSIQAAIDFAAQPRPGGPTPKVCVAGGTTCSASFTYASGPGQTVVLADGVSVFGSYESTGWTRCAGWTTRVRPGSERGLLVPDSVVSRTVLDGFELLRFNAPTTAAATVDGATGAVLTNLYVPAAAPSDNSWGIHVVDGADVVISSSRIHGGRGSRESVGVRVSEARATLTGNCQSVDPTGVCDDGCTTTALGIRGQEDWSFIGAEAYAVLLSDAPGSVVESSALCGVSAVDGALVRVEGDGTGVVLRGNHGDAWAGQQSSHGYWLEECGGGEPWVVDNYRITAYSSRSGSTANGVHAVGDCHPVIDSNRLIRGGGEPSNPSDISGVYCGANASGVASRCVVLGNADIRGAAAGFPTTAAGVRCDAGACVRIAGNTITGVSGQEVIGVYLGATGTLVDDNVITGGCGIGRATGLHSENSWARIQNNRIFAGACQGSSATPPEHVGLVAVLTGSGNEVDVHSNLIDGGGVPQACTSVGLQLEVGTSASPRGAGIFRNNIIRAGVCATGLGVNETSHPADPRIFENNDLDPAGSPVALYRDEGTTDRVSEADLASLSGSIASGNIARDPMFTAYPSDVHLKSGSPCDGAGTPAGAPARDMDGEDRDPTTPDIGPDERP